MTYRSGKAGFEPQQVDLQNLQEVWTVRHCQLMAVDSLEGQSTTCQTLEPKKMTEADLNGDRQLVCRLCTKMMSMLPAHGVTRSGTSPRASCTGASCKHASAIAFANVKPYRKPASPWDRKAALLQTANNTTWRHRESWERMLPQHGSVHTFASRHEPIGGAELTFWSAAA